MRIALFSDIHGNLTGLRAVLEKLDDLGGADVTVAAGDLIAGESGTDEILDLLTSRDIQMVRGDSDTREKHLDLIGGTHPGSGRYPRGYYAALYAWLQKNLSPEGWNFLKELPVSMQVDAGSEHRIFVCHSTPEDTGSRSCDPNFPAGRLQSLFQSQTAEVVAFGHAHQPHVRWIGERLFVNVASVAFQKDHCSMLTLLTFQDEPAVNGHHGASSWTVEQIRVPYNMEVERKRMRQRGVPLPEDFFEVKS